MNTRILCQIMLLTVFITACASPTELPSTPTPLIFPTIQPTVATSTVSVPTSGFTPIPATTLTSAVITATVPPASTNICSDPQVTALIDSFKRAITTADGQLLASLVSPASGLDVYYFHIGAMVNYDQKHAKFLFETTFEVNWGAHPASGIEKIGSFHDVVVPDLVNSFSQSYTLHCNELKYGGASYPVAFPYEKDFYSIYFPGTEANGYLDWHTWVVGVEYVDGKPYLYALMQFFWEP